jgi:hypothetical protein
MLRSAHFTVIHTRAGKVFVRVVGFKKKTRGEKRSGTAAAFFLNVLLDDTFELGRAISCSCRVV